MYIFGLIFGITCLSTGRVPASFAWQVVLPIYHYAGPLYVHCRKRCLFNRMNDLTLRGIITLALRHGIRAWLAPTCPRGVAMPAFPMPSPMARDANSTLVFDLPTTVGALEVSSLIALFLSGILTVQVWLYFQKSSHDHWGLKFLVRAIGPTDMFSQFPIGEPRLVLGHWALSSIMPHALHDNNNALRSPGKAHYLAVIFRYRFITRGIHWPSITSNIPT